MARKFTSITGFILAGGASRRMGQPKALMVLGGQTMLERQAALLREVTDDVAIVGWPAQVPVARLPRGLKNQPRWPDELPDRGPLGGIYTALKQSTTEYNFVLSCDMPFVNAALVRYLCRRALRERADVTAPESSDRHINPVCAVYRRRALESIRANLDSGENKITRCFPRLRGEIIRWQELAQKGFSPNVLGNMNTPQDYEAVNRAWAESGK